MYLSLFIEGYTYMEYPMICLHLGVIVWFIGVSMYAFISEQQWIQH